MRKPTVSGHKGRVTTRNKSRVITSERMKYLLDEFVETPVAERRKLMDQWNVLREAGIAISVIAEEFHVSHDTVFRALKDPEKWVCRPKPGGRDLKRLKPSRTGRVKLPKRRGEDKS